MATEIWAKILIERFGFTNDDIEIAHEYYKIIDHVSCCNAIIYLIHFRVCVFVQNGNSHDIINLEGLPTADARKAMRKLGIFGFTPDLIIKSTKQTVEVTVTSGDVEAAYNRKRNKGETQRPYDIIIVIAVQTGLISIYGDFEISSTWRQLIQSFVQSTYNMMITIFGEDLVGKTYVGLEEYDLPKIKKLEDYELLPEPDYNEILEESKFITFEDSRPIKMGERHQNRCYVKTPSPITFDPWLEPHQFHTIQNIELGELVYTPEHHGFKQWANDNKLTESVLRGLMREIKTIKETEELYVPTEVSNTDLLFGIGQKPPKTGIDLHFTEPHDNKGSVLPTDDMANYWLEESGYTFDPVTWEDPLDGIRVKLMEKWKQKKGYIIEYIFRTTCENVINTSGHSNNLNNGKRQEGSEVKIYSMGMKCREGQLCLGYLIIPKTHFVSRGAPKNSNYVSITIGDNNVNECAWNCFIFRGRLMNRDILVYIKGATFNYSRWNNAIDLDRHHALAVAKITADVAATYQISLKSQPINGESIAKLTQDSNLLYFVWHLLSHTCKESSDEGLLPLVRVHAKATTAENIAGWNGKVMNMAALQKKIKGNQSSDLAPFLWCFANKQEWVEETWMSQMGGGVPGRWSNVKIQPR